MEKEEIKSLLPHRKPMLLVDRMDLDGEYCVSEYRVKGDEPFIQGHFPGMPVVPGVILAEMMGQGSALLIREKLDGKTIPMFVGMDNVRFKHPVHPGDVVQCRAKILSIRGNLIFIESRATVNGQLCCSAHLSVALVKPE